MAKSINTVITKTARKKLVKARAGAAALPAIVGMVFGDGGVDGENNVIPPAEEQTGLNNELFRKAVDSYEFISETACRYECTLEGDELAGSYISEIGLCDSEGDVICIKSFTQKGKDSDMEMTFSIDDVF